MTELNLMKITKSSPSRLPAMMSKSFFTLCIFGLLFSCQTNSDLENPDLSIDRSTFIDGSSRMEQKLAFSKLSFEKQRDLWISKLYQIERLNLSSDFTNEVRALRNEVSAANSDVDLILSDKLINSAANLATLTTEQEFMMIFGSLEDYSINSDAKYDMKNYSFSSTMRQSLEDSGSNKSNRQSDGSGDPCNCRWSCGDSLSYCTHSECEETERGCGFLWLQSCSKRDELLLSECP